MVSLELHLTDTCNLHCGHCYAGYSSDNHTFLSIRNIKKALGDFQKLGDCISECPTIALSGGEPLLHPDIIWIIDYCASNFPYLTILTNGRALTDDLLSLFADFGNVGVQVSIEGNEYIHDKIRGIGTYKEVLSRIDSLGQHGINCRCAMTVNALNLSYMEDYINICNDLHAHPTFHRYIPLGRGRETMQLSAQDNAQMFSKLYSLNREFGILPHCNLCSFITSGGMSPEHHPCYIGTSCLVIDHQGAIVPCPYLGNPIAHISESDLSEVYFSSDLLRKFRERDYGEICRTCPYTLQCGGCRALSFAYTGDMFADEPLCPRVIESKKRINLRLGLARFGRKFLFRSSRF
ncbi:MAG: radical SAM protein [Methanospirillum sp.]